MNGKLFLHEFLSEMFGLYSIVIKSLKKCDYYVSIFTNPSKLSFF